MTPASSRNLDGVRHAPNFVFVKGAIESADLVRHFVATEDIDTIMHFAAQTHVDNSFANSIDFTVGQTCSCRPAANGLLIQPGTHAVRLFRLYMGS